MTNLIAFLNSFLSYLLLFGVFVLLAALAIAIGITLRKRKNASVLAAEAAETNEATADTANE